MSAHTLTVATLSPSLSPSHFSPYRVAIVVSAHTLTVVTLSPSLSPSHFPPKTASPTAVSQRILSRVAPQVPPEEKEQVSDFAPVSDFIQVSDFAPVSDFIQVSDFAPAGEESEPGGAQSGDEAAARGAAAEAAVAAVPRRTASGAGREEERQKRLMTNEDGSSIGADSDAPEGAVEPPLEGSGRALVERAAPADRASPGAPERPPRPRG